MVVTSVLKAVAKISSSIPVEKTVLGTDTVPALALPKADIASAEFCPELYWK